MVKTLSLNRLHWTRSCWRLESVHVSYRGQSVAACGGGGRVGHAVRRRERGAGRAWRAPARHCGAAGAGVRGARCTPLGRAPPAPAPARSARARPHSPPRPHRAFSLLPSACTACTGTTPPTRYNTRYLSIVDFARFCTFWEVADMHPLF